jgi:hypothetical protein
MSNPCASALASYVGAVARQKLKAQADSWRLEPTIDSSTA